ncbi:hypothetical protein SUBVAR_05844 [Subdoligranulum variabile DSM 15176]|uniref:Uncharacterized protein n=1 Tax=Subdoligranulum variabile DSM 15176 TaxID=411471 RepID=D1PNC5_9FIRM|nr:hypothetical protein SUBVAR_05844 [Subdoligranulum variabile DSM 15176]
MYKWWMFIPVIVCRISRRALCGCPFRMSSWTYIPMIRRQRRYPTGYK